MPLNVTQARRAWDVGTSVWTASPSTSPQRRQLGNVGRSARAMPPPQLQAKRR